MANTTFKGNVRSEDGLTVFNTASDTGVETNKATIDSSGNTSLSGTLAVTGATTITGLTTINNGEATFSAPPFVSGLQENIGVDVLDNHTIMHEAIFANTGAATHIWETNTDNSAAVAAVVGTDLLHGGFTLATGGTSGHQTSLSTSATNYICTVGKPWWVKTRFNLNDHDGVEFFFGLTERAADVDTFHNTAAGGGTDRIGFVKAAHNADAVVFGATKNAGGTIATAFDTAQTYDADLSVVSYGIQWDGVDSIKFFASKVVTTATPTEMALIHTFNTAAGIPDVALRLALHIETGTGAVSTARIEYIKGAYTK